MLKKYQGRANRQALCLCEFIAPGFSMSNKGCPIHQGQYYACDQCSCTNYRPNRVKLFPGHWPLCCCGHIAQEHNS